MLFNKLGQQVQVNSRFDSTSHPRIFAPLREVHQPDDHSCGSMFRVEERARVIDKRK